MEEEGEEGGVVEKHLLAAFEAPFEALPSSLVMVIIPCMGGAQLLLN